jgi:D-alanyl-D-alanine carboxypeptidase (penicillin-binding protein 5/6)
VVHLKRCFVGVLVALLLTSGIHAGAISAPPSLSAEAAILLDADTGRILYSQNPNEQRSIASITKLMTALLAVEHWDDLSQNVEVQKEWTLAEGSSMYLKEGETVTREELLYGLLLSSGNDAALALASSCAGAVDTFVQWMNERAQELGMKNTHFANPNGLDEEGHYSTAYDMSLLAMECMKNDTIAKIVSTKSITLGTRSFTNHNKLLWRYDGCIGMKTGYTDAAGRTLITCAERNGQRFIVVTLYDPNDWADHAKLYDYAFRNWTNQSYCSVGERVSSIPVKGSLVRFAYVVPAENFSYPLAEGESLRSELSLPDSIEAPVLAGEEAGSISFYLGSTKVGEVKLVYEQSVRREAYTDESLLDRILSFLNGEKTPAWAPTLLGLEIA